MSQGVQQYPCSVCGKGGHRASNCKELGIPPDGFYKPAPGQHQRDDDEDETVTIHITEILYSYKKWYQRVLRANRSKKLSLP